MTIRDRLYLRVGLFFGRYGRMWCAFIEGLVLGFGLLLMLYMIYGAGKVTWYLIDTYTTAHQKVVKAETEAKAWERTVLACLNGQVIGRAGDEVVACEGAVTFRMGAK